MLKLTKRVVTVAFTYSLFNILGPSAIALQDGAALEEILVTAQRRIENIQNISITVSAFTPEGLEQRGISQALDITQYVPNLLGHNNTGQGTANNYALRGLGNTESIATFDPPVGTYIDDIYISRQNANNFAFFDMERVEVLRGPQGTLFGRNTTGGAVRLILKKPGEELSGNGEVSYGRFNEIQVHGTIDIPVTEKLFTKVSAYYVEDDGYVRNLNTGDRLNDTQSYGVRGAIRFLPTPDISWDVSLAKVNHDEANIIATPTNGEGVPATSNNALFTSPLIPAEGVDLPRVANTGLAKTPRQKDVIAQFLAGEGSNFNEVDNWLITSNLQFPLQNITLEVITGYVDLEQDFALDFFDGAFFPTSPYGTFSIANEGKHKQFTQELKGHGSFLDGFIDAVGGLYFLNEKNDARFAQINGFRLFNPLNAGSLLDYDRLLENDTTSYAAYAQLDWNFTSNFSLTTGMRFTDEKKELKIRHFLDVNPALVGPTTSNFTTDDLEPSGVPTKLDTSIWTPRFALNFKASDDVLLFASVTRGFKSGGWNARGVTAGQLQAFSAEKTWSYEVGLKSQWLDDRLRLNATAFYGDTADFQLPAAFMDETGSITFITRNFADLEVYGLELEANAVISEYLNVYSNLGFQESDYKGLSEEILAQQQNCQQNGLQCGEGIITPDGDISKPVRTPDITWTSGFDAQYPLGFGDMEIALNGHLVHVGSHLVAVANTPEGFTPSRWIVNANIALQNSDDRWALFAECANCFGETYVHSALAGFVYFNEPSRWRIGTRFSF